MLKGKESSSFFYEFDLSEYKQEAFLHLLSVEEKKRLQFYRFPREQRRFAARRALLRIVLAEWLKIEPTKILIQTNAFGKPEVEGIYFNLSHADEKLIIAISLLCPIGVDIEKKEDKKWSLEAEEFLFSHRERACAATMSAFMRKEYFFSIWTKKEAWLKAIGCGLSSDLRVFDTEAEGLKRHFISLPVADPYTACFTHNTSSIA